jgi:hypothetical protein
MKLHKKIVQLTAKYLPKLFLRYTEEYLEVLEEHKTNGFRCSDIGTDRGFHGRKQK